MTSAELRTARIALGLSQEALARRLGVSLRTVAGWEAGRRTLRAGITKPAPIPLAVELAVEGMHAKNSA